MIQFRNKFTKSMSAEITHTQLTAMNINCFSKTDIGLHNRFLLYMSIVEIIRKINHEKLKNLMGNIMEYYGI